MLQIWRVNIDPAQPLPEHWTATLSADELVRAERFHHDADRCRFVLGRCALRDILAHTADSSAVNVRFEYGAAGKPAAPDLALSFNLSHAHNLMLLAVSDLPVGVDLEYMAPIPELMDVARDHFSRDEMRQLNGLPANEQVAAFYRIWTRKEALVKAAGDGLLMPLGTFSVSLQAASIWRELSTAEDVVRGWRLFGFVPAADYVAALAIDRRYDGTAPQFRDYADIQAR